MYFKWKKAACSKIAPGDKIIITGYMASHGMAILSARENMSFNPPIKSDVAPLAALVDQVLQADCVINAMRDPTRG